jgi:hypothetical protein
MSTENVPTPSELPNPAIARTIPIHQEKAALFRVIHADGVWCSVNALSQIHLAFFSERQPIPKKIYFGVDQMGKVVGEMPEKREGREGWFREIEVNVVLTIDSAKAVIGALQSQLAIAEKQMKDFQEILKK